MRTGTVLTYLLAVHLSLRWRFGMLRFTPRGSNSLVVDSSGNMMSETRYKAWGEIRYTTGTTTTPYSYTGQYSNAADFGWMYYKARWRHSAPERQREGYDPILGRFAQADSIVPGSGDPRAWDRYAYVKNSPVVYNDPSGHWPCDEIVDGKCNKNSDHHKDGKINKPPPYETSNKGLEFVTQFEGIRTSLYNDPANNCTIGVGHLVHMGTCNGNFEEEKFLSGITIDQAKQLLKADLRIYEEIVNEMVIVDVTQYQFDALVSFVFNIGGPEFSGSTLLELLNQGKFSDVSQEFKRWVYGSNYEILPGLIRRRNYESQLFENSIYGEW